jgi:hypothetical protein
MRYAATSHMAGAPVAYRICNDIDETFCIGNVITLFLPIVVPVILLLLLEPSVKVISKLLIV